MMIHEYEYKCIYFSGDANHDFHDVAMLYLQWMAVAAAHTLNRSEIARIT
jgi:hypothetical protein